MTATLLSIAAAADLSTLVRLNGVVTSFSLMMMMMMG